MSEQEIDQPLVDIWIEHIIRVGIDPSKTWLTHIAHWNKFGADMQERLKDVMEAFGVDMAMHVPSGVCVLGIDMPEHCRGVNQCLN